VDVDRLVPGWRLSDGELTAALSTSQTELNRMYARMLELVEEADNRGLAAGKGFRDTKAFLVRALRISPKEADARIAAATADLPATKAALAAGEISSEHVHEIAKVLTHTVPAKSLVLFRGRFAGAYLGGVFAVGDVADVVKFVLDAPVFPSVDGELWGIRSGGVATGDTEDCDGAAFLGLDVGDVAFNQNERPRSFRTAV
jgi:hypothetical protein